jgi:sarcosine oxidase subunit delta
MKLIPCPLNGLRPVGEFACLGPAKPMPADDAAPEAWADYAYAEDNPAGPILEWWLHVPSGTMFVAERDTVTDTMIRTLWPADWRAAGGRP